MNDIRTVLRIVARRLEIASFVERLHVVAVVLAALAVALMIADRVGAASFVPWLWVAPTLAAAAVLSAGFWWARQRRTEPQVALAADDRLDLAEKLSTALYCEGRRDPFAQAAIEDAVTVARDPRTRESAKRRFAVGAPNGWWMSPVIVLVALMISMLQPLDLFATDDELVAPAADLTAARQTVQTEIKKIHTELLKDDALKDAAEKILGDMTKDGFDPNADREKTPDQLKRDAIKKVSEINKKLEEILQGEKGKTMEALRQALQDLKSPQDGAAKELADALASGDFKAAQEKLKALLDDLENGHLTDEQKEQLAKQMQDIADQLQKLAQQQAALENALKNAGLDPQLAQNPEALQQALQNAKNLNQQQIQQLQQMAQAQQAAAKMCQGLGQACQNMAQGMQNGQMGQMGEGMGDQLGQMEQMQMMLQQAQAAANMCQGACKGLGQGLGMAQMPGGAFGNRGQGAGGKAPRSATPWSTNKTKADIHNTGGDIIARMLIDGAEFRGQSNVKAKQVIGETLAGYEEAIDEEQVPPQYRAAHQHYFGELQKMTEAIETKPSRATGDAGSADGASEASGESGSGE